MRIPGQGRSDLPTRIGPWRRELGAWLELLALAGVAFARPVLDLLGRNAELFITGGSSAAEIVAVALVLVLVPPSLLLVAEIIGAAIGAPRRLVHGAACGLLVGVLGAQVVHQAADARAAVVTVVAILLGVAGGAAAASSQLVGQFLRVLALAPIVFVAMFLFASPVQEVAFGAGTRAGASAVVATHPSRVVMVLFDELPMTSLLDGEGHVDAELYPRFAQLAATSTWYRNSMTNIPYTEFAVPAMLSGRFPTDSRSQPIAADHPDNLFTLLDRAGYETNVHEAITRLCPPSSCTEDQSAHVGVPSLTRQALRLWTDSFGDGTPQAAFFRLPEVTRRTVAETRRFQRSLRPADRPRIDFLHVLLPHSPWHLYPDLRDYGVRVPPGLSTAGWSDEWSADTARVQHLLQLQAADRLLGGILDKLDRIGGLDDSLVIVTADHGVGFSPGAGLRSANDANLPDLALTPLLVKLPGQAQGRVDDRPVETVDLLPTIADALGIEVPWRVDGRSALGAELPSRARRLYLAGNWGLPEPGRAGGTSGDMPYRTIDEPGVFARALTARAAPSGGDPALRPYRIGPYGGLVGQTVAGIAAGPPSAVRATTEDPGALRDVVPSSRYAAWGHREGVIVGLRAPLPVAVALNGRIAAVTEATPTATGRAPWFVTLEPSAVAAGANQLRLYEISGPATAPVLRLIQPA